MVQSDMRQHRSLLQLLKRFGSETSPQKYLFIFPRVVSHHHHHHQDVPYAGQGTF